MNLSKIAYDCQKFMRAICPVDTGNMRDTINVNQENESTWVVSIGAPGAPYAVYTNEKWVSPRWKGKPNPNEHWIDQGVRQFVEYLAAHTGGELNYNQSEIDDRLSNKSYWDSEEGKQKLKEYRL